MSICYNIEDVKIIDDDLEYSEPLFCSSLGIEGESACVEAYVELGKGIDYSCNSYNNDVNVENYTILLYSKTESRLEIWNDILREINRKTSLRDVDYLYEILSVVDKKGLAEYKSIISKICKIIDEYKGHLNDGVDLSSGAIFQLVRYIPFFFCKKNIDFYLEKDTGFIGVIIPMRKNKKGTLDLTIMNTAEIYYSYVRKKTGLVKFSGKGFLGDDLKNSDAIMSILRMSDW